MTIWDALLLSVVEGLTEFLPISSTGHMILVGHFLGIQGEESVKSFEVVVQAGAIFAVIWHFRQKLWDLVRKTFGGEKRSIDVTLAVFVAFLPAAVIGLAFNSKIKAYLFGPIPVIIAMVVGGVAILLTEHFMKAPPPHAEGKFGDVGLMRAFKIGCFQCLALWPGTSRSMATILGGRATGLSSKEAAEFSFLLAIPTLLAATAHDLVKDHGLSSLSGSEVRVLLISLVVAFITALICVRGFLSFLNTRSLRVFGWYRIIVGAVLALILLR